MIDPDDLNFAICFAAIALSLLIAVTAWPMKRDDAPRKTWRFGNPPRSR